MMIIHPPSARRMVEVRGFKWPRRPTSVACASVLGEDQFGQWLGVTKGSAWWAADRSHTGIFLHSFVKLVPSNTFWSVCFHPVDYAVDVDIILPVHWTGDILEEVDLELDILRSPDGKVWVRDHDKFDRMRTEWSMPPEIARQAENTCQQIRLSVEQAHEPFGSIGLAWLLHFLESTDTADRSEAPSQA